MEARGPGKGHRQRGGDAVSAPDQVSSEGRGARFWLLVALIVLGFVFIAVNFQKVTIDFIVASAQAPLVVALLIYRAARLRHRAGRGTPSPPRQLRPGS